MIDVAKRESFPTDDAYRAYLATLAKQERDKTIRLARERLQKAEARELRGKRRESPAHQLMLKIRSRARTQKWRNAHVDEVRASNRNSKRRSRAANPEHHRAISRRWRARHVEAVFYANAWYYREHREELIARQCARDRDRRANPITRGHMNGLQRVRMRAKMADPAYRAHRREIDNAGRTRRNRARGVPTRAELRNRARSFEEQVRLLVAEGWTWKEIADITGKSENGCVLAYSRLSGRQCNPNYNARRRQEAANFAAKCFEMREAAFTWKEIAEAVNRSPKSCMDACYKERRRQQEQAQMAS